MRKLNAMKCLVNGCRLISSYIFVITGKKPHSLGYGSYRDKKITKVLNQGSFNEGYLKPGYGFRLDERIIEYPWLFSRLPAQEKGNLLDAGSVLNFDFLLERQPLKNKKIFILTLAPEKTSFRNENISYIYEDLRASSFEDEHFDWIVCLSTLEHVGLDNTMYYTADAVKKENKPEDYLKAIDELHRMLKPGGTVYISVPFGKYENHKWLQVFNPVMIDSIIQRFKPSAYSEKYFRYFPDGWRVSSREMAQEAVYFDIRTNKLESDYAAAARAVCCLEMNK